MIFQKRAGEPKIEGGRSNLVVAFGFADCKLANVTWQSTTGAVFGIREGWPNRGAILLEDTSVFRTFLPSLRDQDATKMINSEKSL